MKLLLRETVDKLGTIGDIVNVPDGYGRNFLLPKGIAVAVTTENLRRLEQRKQELLAAEARKRDDLQALAALLKDKSFTVQVKASEEGHLYGSVTVQTIADALAKDGFTAVEARHILLDHPVKDLGVYDIRLRLYPDVETTVKLWVVEGGTE